MGLSNENGSNGMVMPVVPYGNNSGSGWGNGFSGCLCCSCLCLTATDGEMDGTMAAARSHT